MYAIRSYYDTWFLRVGDPQKPAERQDLAERSPLERLEGIITPNALHFERHHNSYNFV